MRLLRRLIFPLDLFLAALAGAGFVVIATVTSVIPRRKRDGLPKLMVVDAAYSLSEVRARRAEHTVISRDLEGFFSHVWSVHPLVGADPERHGLQMKGLEVTELSPRHTVIEARTGRFPRLAGLPMLNFAVSQGRLLVSLARLSRREGVSVIRVGDPTTWGFSGGSWRVSQGFPS